MTEKSARLNAANQERAEAAVRWEDADNTASETGRPSDVAAANAKDRELNAAEHRIESIENEPATKKPIPR